jgi:hypothetical protein
MNYISVGDKVQFSSRKGPITGIVTASECGRKYHNISITDEKNNCWTFHSRSSCYEDSDLKFLGKADTQKVEVAKEKLNEIISKKNEFIYNNTSKLFDEKVKKGDTVVIRGTHSNWEAEVDEVNYQTGKVGIKRRGVEEARAYGRNVREHRWIAMNCIIEVKHGNGILQANYETIPGQVSTVLIKERYQKELEEKGYTQISFSNGEFISDSYALSKTKEPLDRLSKYRQVPGLAIYDTSSNPTVKFDKEKSLFWLNTGCFD